METENERLREEIDILRTSKTTTDTDAVDAGMPVELKHDSMQEAHAAGPSSRMQAKEVAVKSTVASDDVHFSDNNDDNETDEFTDDDDDDDDEDDTNSAHRCSTVARAIDKPVCGWRTQHRVRRCHNKPSIRGHGVKFTVLGWVQ